MQWVVVMEDGSGEIFGPLDSEDACYRLAAMVSRKPNDWRPVKLILFEPFSKAGVKL